MIFFIGAFCIVLTLTPHMHHQCVDCVFVKESVCMCVCVCVCAHAYVIKSIHVCLLRPLLLIDLMCVLL